MLEQLFGSQTRVKLLQLFLSKPEEKYYVRELTRVLDSQINAVRRELKNLENLDIVKIVEDLDSNGKRKFYQPNTEFVLYPELKSMMQKAQFLVEKKFANALKKTGKIHYLALTGQFVNENNAPIDLLVVGRVNKTKFNNLLKKFEKNIRKEINYTLLEKNEFDYRRSVADRFLYAILDAEKIVLIDEVFSKLQNLEDNEN